MSSKHEDAKLILKLYDLRREAVMRQARSWFGGEFHPTSTQDLVDAMRGDKGAYFRMLTSYWDMAATLVKHGAIDAALFNECNGEHIFVYAKLEPFLAEFRQTMGSPGMLANLEHVVKSMPDSAQRIKATQARLAQMAQMRQHAQKA